jgi:hypothetical protein
MDILKFIPKKAPKLELHAIGPDETWYERAYYVTLLARELKGEVAKLREENKQLLRQVNADLPLSTDQKEFLAMREELNEVHKSKAKLHRHLTRAMQVNRVLMEEVEALRNGRERAA